MVGGEVGGLGCMGPLDAWGGVSLIEHSKVGKAVRSCCAIFDNVHFIVQY